MKQIFYLSMFLALVIVSCKSDPIPEAHFTVETNEPEVGQSVFFMNESHGANRYEWDFGDGFISNESSPSHMYMGTGTFDVTLTAYSNNGMEDKASLTLNVMIPTLLEIEVHEYYDEYAVPYASVLLYSTLPDWDAETNSVAEGYTDENGVVVFSGLEPFVYYVDVWEQDHNNYTLRDEDVGFIRTPEIMKHQINRFIAWVDYVPSAKGTARETRSLKIKSLERIATDKYQPLPDAGTMNWQEVFNRRTIKK